MRQVGVGLVESAKCDFRESVDRNAQEKIIQEVLMYQSIQVLCIAQ